MKSKYIVFPQKQEIAVWEEDIDLPQEGEILCKAETSLISIGTELYCLRGVFDPGTNWADWVHYPFRPGYSMVGRVIGVGKGVRGIKEGDRIAHYGVHQQYSKVKWAASQARADVAEGTGPYPLPDAISTEDATWRSLAITCQNAMRRAEFQFGEIAAVVGLGLLGQLVTRYLAAAGARTIIAIDPVQGRLDLARKGGATHVLQVDVNDAVKSIRDITDGWMVDVAFEVTGHPAVLAPTLQLVRKLGRLVLLGDTPTPTQQHLAPGVVSNSITILGTHGNVLPDKATPFTPWSAARMSALFFDYLARGRMNVSELVTHRYAPQQAPEVYQNLSRNRLADIGVLFDWSTLD